MAITPTERSLRAEIAAHTSWANTPNRSARTAPARKAALARFEKQVDPDGKLSDAERTRRAESARKAYFKKLALKSAVARRKAKELTDVAAIAERELEQQNHDDLGLPSSDDGKVGGEV
ncbi:MAG: hypothetical protein WBA05_09230 [Gordonia sp. (in: high G+C Gram-positive bacteria)]|uniref:hypothetical protein n=1 Tax=Gordonia sp. (in: high G+C Gram-positive bacteria) TaxID=84139 RepID=UPI003C74AB68